MKSGIEMFLGVMLVFCGVAAAQGGGASDEDIRSRLVMAFYVEDDHPEEHNDSERRMIDGAFRMAESNRVRFARILCDLARTNEARIVGMAIPELGVYGTPEQLPFLYSQISNTEHGVWAVKAILNVEGITSNSVAMVDGYLSMTNMVMSQREDTCLELLRIRNQTSPDATLSNEVDLCAFRFFGRDNVYSEWYDELVQPLIHGYKTSKRRLNVLRAVQHLGLNKYNDVFITNAINELVAYPEANLPD